MMIFVMLAVAATCYSTAWMVPRLVALIAIGLVLALAWQARRLTGTLLGARRVDLEYDQKPTRAARRAMRASLRVALDQNELRSLFPGVMAQADRCTCAWH